MDYKINGNYYLVQASGWNEAGFCVARFKNIGGVYFWVDVSTDADCAKFVTAYKAIDKVGKMRPFAVLSISHT